MTITQAEETLRRQLVTELTSFMLHKHYCENDAEAIIAQMDGDIIWMGAAEHEYARGKETVAHIFRQFAGQVPKCNISDEEYQALQLGPETYLCSGRLWIATDPSTQISLRVHQRITTAFRFVDGLPRCCHIHISNPYGEMTEEDVGFPTNMARQSLLYLQEQIDLQKAQVAAQTAALRQLSFEDALTGLYNRNKFTQVMNAGKEGAPLRLGVAYFDLNGLKEVNDGMGHSAGDALIRDTADQIRASFDGMAYRIGGDEFVVIDDSRGEEAFRAAVESVRGRMKRQGIHCSVGVSWRDLHCSAVEQFEEADRMMYEDKRHFYNTHENDRRR